MLGIETGEEGGANDSELVASRNRHQVLPADRLAARFDAALIVTRPRTAEARLEQVMRRQRFEARRELPLGANESLIEPASSTSTSKKSTSARSPGGYTSGTNTSRRLRFHSATAPLTVVTPIVKPSASNILCRRAAVSRCLPPVHCGDSASSASNRPLAFSQTGRPRATRSTRVGAACDRYRCTVLRETPISRATRRADRPSTSTLCRIT